MARTLADDMVADLELALPESIRWIPMSERSIAAQRLVLLGWTKAPQVPAPTTGEQGRTR